MIERHLFNALIIGGVAVMSAIAVVDAYLSGRQWAVKLNGLLMAAEVAMGMKELAKWRRSR